MEIHLGCLGILANSSYQVSKYTVASRRRIITIASREISCSQHDSL